MFFTRWILIADERIAVEYLLAQSNRGDLLSQQTDPGDIQSEVLDEGQDECPDETLPHANDVSLEVILNVKFDHPFKKNTNSNYTNFFKL